MSEEIRWTKIGPLPGAIQAEMLAEVLKERDIAFRMISDWEASAFGTRGFTGVSTPGYIYVPEEHSEEVSDLIEEMFGDSSADADRG